MMDTYGCLTLSDQPVPVKKKGAEDHDGSAYAEKAKKSLKTVGDLENKLVDVCLEYDRQARFDAG